MELGGCVERSQGSEVWASVQVHFCRVQVDNIISLAGMGHITIEIIGAPRQMGLKENHLLRKLCVPSTELSQAVCDFIVFPMN